MYARARLEWRGTPCTTESICLTLVYLCDESPVYTDNIIKPIKDALIGVVFADDFQVTDVDSHRRFLSQGIDITKLPRLLSEGVESGMECIYVRVCEAKNLELYI